MAVVESERDLERVLATYAPALTRIAASYESRPALREELLQDIAFAIWRALPAFRGESSERSFVLRIATNRALSHMAARQPEKGVQCLEGTVSFFQSGKGDSPLDVVDPAPRPDEMAARHQGAERLQRAVRELPLLPRQVMVLAFEGLDHEEIARVLGTSANNVAVRLHRGKALLKQMLGGPT